MVSLVLTAGLVICGIRRYWWYWN